MKTKPNFPAYHSLRRHFLGALVEMRHSSKKHHDENPNSYPAWIAENEPNQSTLASQNQSADTLDYHPLISILVPLHMPDMTLLAEMLNFLTRSNLPALAVVSGRLHSAIRRVWQLVLAERWH